MMLRRKGAESLFQGCQEKDWRVGAGKPVRFTATESVVGSIEQAIRIRWPLEGRHLGNVGLVAS